MARREAYAYIRPASEEEKDFPQVLKVEGSTVTLKESSSRTRSLAVDGVYQSDQTQLLDDSFSVTVLPSTFRTWGKSFSSSDGGLIYA